MQGSGGRSLGVFVGVLAPGELDPETFDAVGAEAFGVAGRRPVSGVVGVVGHADAADFLRQNRVEQFAGKPFGAVNERHVVEAMNVERERIERRFAEDQFEGLPNRWTAKRLC